MNKGRQLLLISSSKVHGHEFLQQPRSEIVQFLKKNNVSEVLFVPFAGFDYDAYTKQVAEAFNSFGFDVVGIHTKPDAVQAVESAQCLFVGGGNTFKLLTQLYASALIQPIRRRVLAGQLAYMGSSAGTNVATRSIHTTNDMPIVFPPSFDALALVPFNINPHYLDADPSSVHQGETRETRLLEYLQVHAGPVLALREGTALRVDGDQAHLVGDRNARVLQQGKPAVELEPNTDVSYLLKA